MFYNLSQRLYDLQTLQTSPDWLDDLPEQIAEELGSWKVASYTPEHNRRGNYPTCLTELVSSDGVSIIVRHVDPAIERLYVDGIRSVGHRLEFFRAGRKK